MPKYLPQFKLSKLNGIFTVHNPKSLDKYKQGLKDGDFFLTIAPPKKETRSLQLNKYYWGVVIDLYADHTGNTPNQMHCDFSEEFLDKEFWEFKGKTKSRVVSTTSLSNDLFWEYIQLCVQLAAEDGVVIPDPEQVIIK